MKHLKEAYEELRQVLDRASAIQSALALIEWDNETLAPQESGKQTSKTAGILSGLYYGIMTGDELGRLLESCQEALKASKGTSEPCKEENEVSKDGGNTGQKVFFSIYEEIRQMCREAEKERQLLTCIPRDEYEEFTRLTSAAGRVWAEAREKKDFSMFAPVLEKIVECKKKMASYRRKDGQSLYDAMLADFEESFPEEKLDEFFGAVKKELVPFLEEIKENRKQADYSFLHGNYPKEKQEKLAKWIAEYIGFDFKKGVLSESAHPFTTSFHNKDVRITTHYDDYLDHSLFSVIHEGGHALYEMGIDDRLTQTILGQGASMAMHESQSRFMENIIGRSEAFWEPIYGRLQKLFPEQLAYVPLEIFIEAINHVEPGFIRTNADELTYSLHIMVRYDLEKALISGEIQVKDLEKAWADKYEEYLGIRPENPAEGVLQDIHWSQGSFGYFPSYALGSAFAAQIYEKMKKMMDVDGLLRAGNVNAVREYLWENIHRFGKMKDSRSLLKDTTGEDFNPEYYIRYLKEKYSKICVK